MKNEESGEIFDLNKDSKTRCMLCECVVNAHPCFWPCPIFDNFSICSTCCTVDVLRSGIEKVFSEKLGREITREEINKMCRDCGRNHATQDDEVADRLIFNSFDEVVQENKDENEKKKNNTKKSDNN